MDTKLKLRTENSNKTDMNGKLTISNQVLEKSRRPQKPSDLGGGSKNKVLRQQARSRSPTVSNNPVKKDPKSCSESLNAMGKNLRQNHQNSSSPSGASIGAFNNSVGNCSRDFFASRSRDQSYRKFTDYESRGQNYPDYGATNHQEYKPRANTSNPTLSQLRFSNQIMRDSGGSLGQTTSRNETSTTTVGTTMVQIKAMEQQPNMVPKMGQINFPPLRAPQSIVNVRHPFVTEARMKQNDIGANSGNQKSTSVSVVTNSLQNSVVKDLEHNRQTFHGYGSSPIANMQSVQNLGSIASLAQYPRPDSFPQQTLASVLFSESSQYPQSPSYTTQQVGQIGQFQAYDPGSFTPTPVNVNSVMQQFSADSSQLSYTQFDNPPQFVQTNHYPAADLANGQFQYQPAGVGQMPESPLYLQSLQSLQSPLAGLADQYATPNYAQAVRTELIPRLRRPPRFNK